METKFNNVYKLKLKVVNLGNAEDTKELNYHNFNPRNIHDWADKMTDRYHIEGWTLYKYNRIDFNKNYLNAEVLTESGSNHPINAGAYLFEELEEIMPAIKLLK